MCVGVEVEVGVRGTGVGWVRVGGGEGILDGTHERQRRRPETDPIKKTTAVEAERVRKRGMKLGK